MALVRAEVMAEGEGNRLSGIALVDTGATFTLLDKPTADYLGVRYIGRETRITVADGHEMVGELAVLERISVEGEELPYAHVVIVKFTRELKEKLRGLDLADWCIIGLLTLEALQLIPDTRTGTLRKTTALLV